MFVHVRVSFLQQTVRVTFVNLDITFPPFKIFLRLMLKFTLLRRNLKWEVGAFTVGDTFILKLYSKTAGEYIVCSELCCVLISLIF